MILVVEDVVEIENLLRDVIQEAGYYFDSAVDGESALYKIKRIHYSLVIIDIGLPGGMDGNELAVRIRELPEAFSKVPLVAMTGATATVISDVFVSVLKKPFLPRDVREMVEKYSDPPIKDLHLIQQKN